MNKTLQGGLVGLALGALAPMVSAGTVAWTDWTAAGTNSVTGSASFAGDTVDVSFSGSYAFAQLGGGTNYWSPSTPYLGSVVDNAPPNSEIIGLSDGGTVTINFSRAVVDPLIALVSWNGNVVEFDAPIEFLSFGAGFWGSGSPGLNGTGTGFTGFGELHGVLRVIGTYESISFSHLGENWHGLTVGFTDVAPVPLPAGVWLLGPLLLPLLGRRRQAAGRVRPPAF